MEVAFSDSFKKAFKKRVELTELETEFWIRIELFINEPFHLNLKHISFPAN